MKLEKKDIGKLFDSRGGDGSWVYVYLGKKKGYHYFYSIGNRVWKTKRMDNDWRRFIFPDVYPTWVKLQMETAQEFV